MTESENYFENTDLRQKPQTKQDLINYQLDSLFSGNYLLHSGNIGNLSTAFRQDDSDGMRGANGAKVQDGSNSENGGVHLTS